ncbi:MAG: hypothetical protein KDD33_07805 [Bdellovibrionales bacterium]|nr:hypothetical protein [Bdellovibrionales bacterium]
MKRIGWFVIITLTAQWGLARDPISDEKIGQIIDQFQYITNYQIDEMALDTKGSARCLIYDLDLTTDYPGMPDPLKVDGRLYLPNPNRLGGDTVPMVVMLPPMGGINMLDRRMANTFCDEKIAAYIIMNDFTGVQSGNTPPVDDHDKAFHRTISALKASLAFANDYEHTNGEKVGLFGVSLGGILGSFSMQTQAQVAAGFFIVAGGDVPSILADSDQEDVTRVRQERMQQEGFNSKAEYEAWLRLHLNYDPQDLAPSVPTETVQMVISRDDYHVPTARQVDLHGAFGEPQAYYFNSGHVGTVIDVLLWESNRLIISDFFKERFTLENPRVELARQWLSGFSLGRYF